MLTCRWCPENDDGEFLDEMCGQPARWVSCRLAHGEPVCDEHRCRCREPLLTTRQDRLGTTVTWVDQEVAYVTTGEALLAVTRLWRL